MGLLCIGCERYDEGGAEEPEEIAASRDVVVDLRSLGKEMELVDLMMLPLGRRELSGEKPGLCELPISGPLEESHS